jgi:CPA2 family monovalent cation:H+ antiporter-2
MLLGGTLQVLLTGALAFACARGLGLSSVASLVVAMLVVPSSTAIVLRGLDARGELEGPPGQLMLGILLFQDLCVVPTMLILPALGGGGAALPWAQLARSALLLCAVVGAALWLVPRALHVVAGARQRDAFVLAVLVSCLGTAYAASFAGVSLALGAFLGGVIVAGSEYRHQANAELAPMREVMASLFFVSVGMLLDPQLLRSEPLAVFGTLCALFVGKALVVAFAAGVLRLSLRVAVVAGVGLSQMGEFALVLAREAEDAKVVPDGPLQILLSAATLSMVATPLLLGLGPRVASAAERLPGAARLFGAHVSEAPPPSAAYENHIVVAGFGVAGEALVRALGAISVPVVVVDLNPVSVREVTRRGLPGYFGDVSSRDLLEHLNLPRARQLVLLINDPAAVERAVLAARSVAPELPITARARFQREVDKLRALGASEVIVAELEASHAIVRCVLDRARGAV